MTEEERAAWSGLVAALSAERELLRRQACFSGVDERPSVEECLSSSKAVDEARTVLMRLGVNPFTGRRMDRSRCDVSLRKRRRKLWKQMPSIPRRFW